jgi:ribosome modulation factor
MARKKGDKKGGASAAPKQTLEGLSDDQRYSLTEQHRQKIEKALATKKAASAAYLNACKIAKAELGPTGMDDINDMIALATPEGEARMKENIERQMRVLRWNDVPMGTIDDLFPDTDRTPITERAFNAGKRQGLAGESNNNPHHHATEAHRFHNDGWAEGQKTLATKGFSKLSPDEATDVQKSASLGSSRPTFEVAH